MLRFRPVRTRIRFPSNLSGQTRYRSFASRGGPSTLAQIRPSPHSLRTAYPVISSTKFHTSTPRHAVSPFKLHDIGEGITEVEIIRWYVEDGQEVAEFDALCEVQSDKSVVELTSHANGTVRGIQKSAGEMAKVGQTICEIHTAEETGEQEACQDSVQPDQRPGTEDLPESKPIANQVESPTVKATEGLTETLEKSQEPENASADRPQPIHEAEEHDPIQLQGEASILPSPPRPKQLDQQTQVEVRQDRSDEYDDKNRKGNIKTSPAVRTLATKLGIDLSMVKGSGENGRITKQDVENYFSVSSGPIPSSEAGVKVRSYRDDLPEFTGVELGRTRKIMFRALGEQGKIPHFGYSHTLNLTPLLPYLKASNPQTSISIDKQGYIASDIPSELVTNPIIEKKEKTTILSFLVKGLILALQEHPIMRSRLKEDGEKRFLEIGRDGVIGVAVSDPKYGLLTPSLPPLPPSTTISTITSHLHSLRHAPNKPSTPANITISSVGGLGEATGAMPILPPGGGLAICAVGKAKWDMEWDLAYGDESKGKSVWEMDESMVERGGTRAVLRVPVGWSGDHRILEGAELITFTETWKKYIEQPWRWINVK
ncbi:hypothetical protein L486_02816 [Kwoniella mangroviensis CBS 10435]|uniref:Dihydrolipoamide acetyltransferase component of pyruvate dehydrogenase complex n=1 Tax=Kwoniella mangroviensis CBS 10435 TaxID=1331196 RepID=A0A1B9IX78_9TREE|nr:hypothetical protein L486_02816 [Kwoniella mangroviensis CBS 10435]